MKYIFCIVLFFLNANNASSQTIVIDGDTLKQGELTYRLEGIDAPEYGQKCRVDETTNKTWPCGKKSTEFLTGFIHGKMVSCREKGIDDFGRILAVCYTDEIEINQYIVENGFAWAFRKFSNNYVAEEEAARSLRIGVFRAETQTPWDYRAARWKVATQEAPEGCPIKGNISNNGRIYHAPWSPWYKRTKINLNKGERWFCSEGEALQAGWRAPYWGR